MIFVGVPVRLQLESKVGRQPCSVERVGRWDRLWVICGNATVSSNPPQIPLLLTLYREYLDHQDSAGLVDHVSQRYTPGTLQRLAESQDRQVRRAAVLALGLIGDYSVNHTLGRALLDDDRTVRTLAQNAIRAVWTRAGNRRHHRELQTIIRLNDARQYEQAILRATELIEEAPSVAEAWNQRAIARFSLGQFQESIRDCHQVLELNPYHFPAAAGMGQAYLELGNHVSALESFRRALRLCPDLEAVRVQVVRLRRMVEGT
jgi:tetratricopeptide (TPR) repeat protein